MCSASAKPIRISRLPAWQQALIKETFPRRKLIEPHVYQAIMNLAQLRYTDDAPAPQSNSEKPDTQGIDQ